MDAYTLQKQKHGNRNITSKKENSKKKHGKDVEKIQR